jgi:predicted dinucleotide-binding enzyme
VRFGILGTGVVGRTLGTKLVELGYEVTIGSRHKGNDKAAAWVQAAGGGAGQGTFNDAAAFGEIVINATPGVVSLDVLRAAGAANVAGKVLVDVSNPLAPDTGFPPLLSVCNTDSMGEQIQREFPSARVVKTLNTVNADVMVNPRMINEHHAVFVSGEDASAKGEVTGVLRSFGWDADEIVDLGGITTARGPEMYLELWLRLMAATGTGHFNIRIVREASAPSGATR